MGRSAPTSLRRPLGGWQLRLIAWVLASRWGLLVGGLALRPLVRAAGVEDDAGALTQRRRAARLGPGA